MTTTISMPFAMTRSLSKALLPVAPGRILSGARWNYRIKEAVGDDKTHISPVFKAEIIQREHSLASPQWAAIKAAVSSDTEGKDSLRSESSIYSLPGVASAACIRKLYEVLDFSMGEHSGTCLALEWLDTTLAEVRYQPGAITYAIIQSLLRSALSSCTVLENNKVVNTDFKPANILISGIGTGRIVAKVGDLGRVYPTNKVFNAYPYAMRAPEVFLGHVVTEASQVWAIAAMLLVWIKPKLLGVSDCPHWLLNEAWSMGKLKRLFPSWALPDLPGSDELKRRALKAQIKVARRVSLEELEMLAISPLNVELQGIEMPKQLRDLLRFMLIVDPKQRPSASSVLASKEFLAFEKLTGN